MKYFFIVLLSLMMSACETVEPLCTVPSTPNTIYVLSAGWHTEIGVPVSELDAHLQFYKDVFPGARTLMFGYGKRTFFTAPVETPDEYLLGPFPGPAVIHVVGISVSLPEAYPDQNVMPLELPPGGASRLSEYIWKDLEKEGSNKPAEIAKSANPDGLFYNAVSGYNLLHTCNTWTAEALSAAGLPVSSGAVVFAGQISSQVKRISQEQCN